MNKQKTAKILIITILCLSTLMFLPWIYLTPIYYIMRYAIMAMTAVTFVFTFSLTRCMSIRFVRLLILTIVCMLLIYLIIPVRTSDIAQLVVALITLTIGAGLDWNEREWANISYYYTILMVTVTLCNCLFYAGGLYIPEHYSLQKLFQFVFHHFLCCCNLACCFWASSRRFWKLIFFCGFFLFSSMVARTLSSSIILRKINICMKVMMLTNI